MSEKDIPWECSCCGAKDTGGWDGLQAHLDKCKKYRAKVISDFKPDEHTVVTYTEVGEFQRWHDAAKSKPECPIDVLCALSADTDDYRIGHWDGDEWSTFHHCCSYHGPIHEKVLFWRHLPKPPIKGKA